jgi:acetyl-CoA acetyltransferase
MGAMPSGSREIAIVGVGQTDHGALYTRDSRRDAYGLAAEALRLALEDAGLAKEHVDGLICARVDYNRMADVAGLRAPRVVYGLEGSGRMSGVAVQHAVSLIRGGAADTVALVYGNNGRSVKMRYGGEGGGPTVAYDAAYGMASPGAYVSMMYQRYRHLYRAPEDALAPIAINNRRHASLNPVAVMRKEIDTEEYLASRFIAEPLRLFDYCIINDGGVALILTTAERARSLPKTPVRVAATAASADLTNYYTSTDLFDAACQDVAARVYDESGLGPEQMDCLQIYDNFTPTVLFTLEGFGHAKRGEGWQWVREGRIGFDGERPINTAGGHTAESYMQGWAHHVEAVRQLRGEAGARQVRGCVTAQYMCASPIVTSHVLVAENGN